ncbi:MAG TPA: (d)CMP kinase [Candidatus Deferrimicrobiaceae bacterium]
MSGRPIVTIDGPSGAGKSTVSRLLAERTSLVRLDTGAMYRGVAWAARKAGVPWSDGSALGRICGTLRMEFRAEGGDQKLVLDGEDVSAAIRTPEISMGASEVSSHGSVREAMVALQRKMGEAGGVVLEGRDIGTVVFPEADVKFFLDAHAAVRALRRYREWGPGPGRGYEEVFREVLRRDIQDSTREHSPLRVPDGAIRIDSTVLTVGEVVEEMMRHLPAPADRPTGKAGR